MKCPKCGQDMTYHPGRRDYFCLVCNVSVAKEAKDVRLVPSRTGRPRPKRGQKRKGWRLV